ncbi:hypothetical protein ASPFODRAFT_55216 [Aspergillus luchuensis CBS 106.47]|uniref:Carboxylesterase type B domain-containing protein n=1 Tax=Aspergillus luchuensis (strain CBS 106.47) TaxID=1137211 RepID=A0A1M3TXN8_ASPLC|nr:hypothetical protein ASPFODRAFT_55216 [Aspergillus luchuensis CBS 106.47]
MENHVSWEQTPCELNLGSLGPICGLQRIDDKVHRYVRVPYALPPIGAYPDETRLDATILGPVCPQAYLSSGARKTPGFNWTLVNAPPPGQRRPVVYLPWAIF